MLKKSLLVLAASVVVFLVWLLVSFLAPRISYLPAFFLLPETSMLLFVMSFYLKLDELDTGQTDGLLWATIRRHQIPRLIAVVSILLFALAYVGEAMFLFVLTLNYAFLAFIAIFLGMVSVFLKFNLVDRGKLVNEYLEMSDSKK